MPSADFLRNWSRNNTTSAAIHVVADRFREEDGGQHLVQLVIRPMASARVAAFTQLAAYGAGYGLRAWLANAAHGHAQVLAFDHHDHPARFQNAIDGIGDLRGQPLLHLGSFGIEIDEAGQFAEPGDLAISARYVADVSNPGERHEMVLAAAPHLDVFDQHQLVVAQVEDGGQHRLRILPKPAEHLRVRPRNALRGIAQSVPIGIFTDPDQDLPYRGDDPGMIELSYRRSGK